MITQNEISKIRYNVNDLTRVKNDLILERMKLDKYMSEYLDTHDLDDTLDESIGNYNTEEWKNYKQKFDEYQNIQRLIFLTDFYLR